MTTVAQIVRRPFHESIVETIVEAGNNGSGCEVWLCLARLIRTTKIPKGHDEIIAAWRNKNLDDDLGVTASLLEQKKEAAEKEQTAST